MADSGGAAAADPEAAQPPKHLLVAGQFTPTQEQSKLLGELRDVLQSNGELVAATEYNPTDIQLLQFLIARDWKLPAATKMLVNHLAWRKSWDAHKILEWTPPEALSLLYPAAWLPSDNEGRPVYYEGRGRYDIRAMMRVAKEDDIIKFKVQSMEEGRQLQLEQSKKLGRNITQTTAILDLEGMGFSQAYKPGINMIQRMRAIFEDNYPEHIGRVYIIRPPGVFPVIWAILHPFLAKKTKEKIHVLGSNWQKVLKENIPLESLPEHLGGTCTSVSIPSGEIPEKYYMSATLLNGEQVEEVTVAAGADHHKVVSIQRSAVLAWSFETAKDDIGFGVFRKPHETSTDRAEWEKIVELEMHTPTIVPSTGSIVVSEGYYVALFDNKHSWFTSKAVKFIIEVNHESEGEGGATTRVEQVEVGSADRRTAI